MTKADKILFRKQRSLERAIKNRERNKNRWQRNGRDTGIDCPVDVEISNIHGTCNCGGKNYNDCLGDI